MIGAGFFNRLRFFGLEWRSGIFAAATLAVVVAAAMPFFSLVEGILWRPLPYPEPGQLVLLWETSPQWSAAQSDRLPASYLNFLDWQSSARSFQGMAGVFVRRLRLDASRFPIEIHSAAVTEDFFAVLGRCWTPEPS